MGSDAIRLVAFDMEGCLTTDPTVWEIMHRKLDTWERYGSDYWDRYRAGEFPYDEFATMDVAVWRGAAHSVFREAADEVRLMSGAAEVLDDLRARGVSVVVISNGLRVVAARFERDFGAVDVFANAVCVEDGHLTGGLDIRVPHAAKGEILRALCSRLGVAKEHVAAVGDAEADVAMFREARISVAVNPSDPVVSDAATHTLTESDLSPLLDILSG